MPFEPEKSWSDQEEPSHSADEEAKPFLSVLENKPAPQLVQSKLSSSKKSNPFGLSSQQLLTLWVAF